MRPNDCLKEAQLNATEIVYPSMVLHLFIALLIANLYYFFIHLPMDYLLKIQRNGQQLQIKYQFNLVYYNNILLFAH